MCTNELNFNFLYAAASATSSSTKLETANIQFLSQNFYFTYVFNKS